MARVARRFAAILDAEVVGHRRVADEGGIEWASRLARHRVVHLEPAVSRHGGRLLEPVGRGMRAEFPQAVAALGAAVEFQQAMADANRGRSEESAVLFRLGLHLADESGAGVSCLRGERQGGIVVSGPLRDAVAGRVPASFAELGSGGRAYDVGWDPADWPVAVRGAATPRAEQSGRRRIGLRAGAIAGVAALAMVVLFVALKPAPAAWLAPAVAALDRHVFEQLTEPAVDDWPRDDRAANLENAGPVDAYDGRYVGTVTTRPDGRVVTFKVKVVDGVGSGTLSRLDCGTAAVSLRISPSGTVGGMALMFGSTCLKTGLAIRGRAIGDVLQVRVGSQYLELTKRD